jgi:uncharacterized cupin superfamily protein
MTDTEGFSRGPKPVTRGHATMISFVTLLVSLGASLAAQAAEPPGEANNIIRLHSNADLSNFTPMTDFLVKGQPAPVEAVKELYESSPTGLHIGVWAGGPGVLHLTDYPYDEYCFLQEGTLVVTNSSGAVETFRKGDSFVIPKGFKGTWDMKTRMRKQWAVYGPLPALPKD